MITEMHCRHKLGHFCDMRSASQCVGGSSFISGLILALHNVFIFLKSELQVISILNCFFLFFS